MGSGIQINQGMEFINKYLKDLGINKTVTPAEVESIFAGLEKNDDGTVDTSIFALAVANQYASTPLEQIEEEYLDAWEKYVSGVDGNDDTISAIDLKSLQNTETPTEPTTPPSSGDGSGGDGSGSVPQKPGGDSDPETGDATGLSGSDGSVDPVDPAGATVDATPITFTGKETLTELETGRKNTLSALDDKRKEKENLLNSQEVIDARKNVNEKKEKYENLLKEFSDDTIKNEQNKTLDDLKEEKAANKEDIDAQEIDVKQSKEEVSTTKGLIATLNTDLADIKSREPKPEDYTIPNEKGENVPDTVRYQAEKQKWEREKAAKEEEISEAETRLAEQEQRLTTHEQELDALKETGKSLDTQINDLMTKIISDELYKNNEEAKALQQASEEYKDAQVNYDKLIDEKEAAINEDIDILSDNLDEYNDAIEEKEEAEKLAEQEEQGKIDKEKGNALGYQDEDKNQFNFFIDEDNDGELDSASDWLTATGGNYAQLNGLDTDNDGVLTAAELAQGNIKVAITDSNGNQTQMTIADYKEKYGDFTINLDKLNIPKNKGDFAPTAFDVNTQNPYVLLNNENDESLRYILERFPEEEEPEK